MLVLLCEPNHSLVGMAAGSDAPRWTFGLNPKLAGNCVPGPGTYEVAGRLVADGVGTRFARVGRKPPGSQTNIITAVRRLVFDGGVCMVCANASDG